MTNPRKFADKLEIIRRKEEEANAAFDKIMREVSDARSGGHPGSSPQHHPHHAQPWFRGQNDIRIRQKYKGGSLPNVNIAPNPIPVESALFNEIYGQQPPHSYNMGMNYLRRPGEPLPGPIFPSKSKPRSYTVTAPYRNNLLQQPTNPVIAEQNDVNSSMWRRTYSDSAIQHSLQQPPQKKIEGSPLAQNNGGPRIIQTPAQPIKNNEMTNFPSPPTIRFNDVQPSPPQPPKSHMQMQANTNSLPDLSNLSIPSPIQNPIDNEAANEKSLSPQEMPNPFQSPFRVPRRIVGRQIYSRPNNNEMDSKMGVFPNMAIDKNEMNTQNSNLNNNIVNPSGAPLSPVTTPPYYWNNTPMSPLASTDDMMGVSNGPTDLQQQLQQFQMQNERGNPMPPPSYPFMTNESENFGNMYPPVSGMYAKQPVMRINSGPPTINTMMMNSKDLKSNELCDRELDSALMKFKSPNYNNSNNTEISEEDLNSVRLALNPLDFNDVSILNDDNSDLVDQTTEEHFRLERATGF